MEDGRREKLTGIPGMDTQHTENGVGYGKEGGGGREGGTAVGATCLVLMCSGSRETLARLPAAACPKHGCPM